MFMTGNGSVISTFIGAIAQISVLANGSTGSRIIKQELVHVRYERDNGDTSIYMIKCKPVKSANAAGVLEAIEEAANTMEETWKKKVMSVQILMALK